MQRIYGDASGYTISSSGYDSKYALTYGEITQEGIEQLGNLFLSIHPIDTYPVDQRTFYDLGSGIGKLVISMALLNPNIRSKGIELVKERHEKALTAHSLLRDKSAKERINFYCCSFFDQSIADAAWIFISNLCFSETINKEISDKLTKELKSKTLIACSKVLPVSLESFRLINTYNISMTWNPTHSLYLYEKI